MLILMLLSMTQVIFVVILMEKKFRICTQPLLYRLSETQEKVLFEQYTIHTLNGKRSTDILEAFQMKGVEQEAISLFERNLDLMGFPDLFPTC